MTSQDCMCLLDIAVEQDAMELVKKSIKKNDFDRVIHQFKVEGENRIVAVLKRGAEDILSGLNHDCGRLATVTSTPLTSYEGFSRNVLKLDEELCVEAHDIGTDDDGMLFWNHFKIGYYGRSASEMLSIWKEEAATALGARRRGLKNDIYKVIAQREVHVFMRASPERLDGVSFALPLMAKMGDQVQITCKRVFVLDDSSDTNNRKK